MRLLIATTRFAYFAVGPDRLDAMPEGDLRSGMVGVPRTCRRSCRNSSRPESRNNDAPATQTRIRSVRLRRDHAYASQPICILRGTRAKPQYPTASCSAEAIPLGGVSLGLRYTLLG